MLLRRAEGGQVLVLWHVLLFDAPKENVSSTFEANASTFGASSSFEACAPSYFDAPEKNAHASGRRIPGRRTCQCDCSGMIMLE